MKGAGAGFLAGKKGRSHLHRFCAERKGGNRATCVSDTAGCDHWHIDDVDNLRNKRQCARQ